MFEHDNNTFNRLLALTKKTSDMASKHGISVQKQKTYTTALAIAFSSLIVAASINVKPMDTFSNYSAPQFNFSLNPSTVPMLNKSSKENIYKGVTPTLIKHPFEDGNLSMVISTDTLSNIHQLNSSSYPDEVKMWLTKASKGLISDITHSHCTGDYASISAYKDDVCLTVLNLNQIDEYFDKFWGKSLYLTFDNIRDLILNHELAHSTTLSNHEAVLDEQLDPDSTMAEIIGDLSAVHKAYKDHTPQIANELVDGLIKMRDKNDKEHDSRQILRVAKAYYSSTKNDSLNIPDTKIIEHSVLMSKVFDSIVNSKDVHTITPEYFNYNTLPSNLQKLSEVPYSYYRKSVAIERLHDEMGIDTRQVKVMDIESKIDLYAENINIVSKHISITRKNANAQILEHLRSTSSIPDNHINIEYFESKMKEFSQPILDTSKRVSLPQDNSPSHSEPTI